MPSCRATALRVPPWTLACLLVGAAGCRPVSETSCGDGTHLEGDQCVADGDTGDSGAPDADSSDTDTGDTDTGDTDTGDTDSSDTQPDTGDTSDTDTDTDTPAFTVCDDGLAPYASVQAAIDAADDGDTITLCAGVWDAVYLYDKDLVIEGESATSTTIFSSTGPAVRVYDHALTLSSLTLRGYGASQDEGGALHAEDATIVATDIHVNAGNTSALVVQVGGLGTYEGWTVESNVYAADPYDPSRLLYFSEGAVAELSHSTFQDNTAYVGIEAANADVSIHNNVFSTNTAAFLLSLAGDTGGDYVVHNNVFYDSRAPSSNYTVLLQLLWTDYQGNIVQGSDHTYTLYSAPDVYGYNLYADVSGEVRYAGTDDVRADPYFTDPGAGDFTLLPGYSPAIDSGSPDARYNDVDGTRNDMGAFGGPNGAW